MYWGTERGQGRRTIGISEEQENRSNIQRVPECRVRCQLLKKTFKTPSNKEPVAVGSSREKRLWGKTEGLCNLPERRERFREAALGWWVGTEGGKIDTRKKKKRVAESEKTKQGKRYRKKSPSVDSS